MWRKLLLCFLCFQALAGNALETKKKEDDDLFSKIKGKGSYKKAKSAALLLHSPESETTTLDLGITLPSEYNNATVKEDHHKYYNSTFYFDPEMGKTYWIELDEMKQEHVITSKSLSSSYRQAITVALSFVFPYYGSEVYNITIATGGFLYMGDYIHNRIAATQYVAPLMANFDTTLSENSTVKYADTGTAVTVQWDNVYIQDRKSNGSFTFQATLFNNGDICFAYKEIPVSISEISDDAHPVKIGISDAYVLERQILFMRRKTIYEYHRAEFKQNSISNNTAIFLKALSTCLSYKSCESCVNADKEMECNWCDAVDRCSDGIDRARHSWIVNGCTQQARMVCPKKSEDVPYKSADSDTQTEASHAVDVVTSPKTEKSSQMPTDNINQLHYDVPQANKSHYGKGDVEVLHYVQEHVETRSGISTGAIVSIIAFLAVLISIGIWIFYAYRFPQTPSGQFLIKYRPSQWNVKPEDSTSNTDTFHI